jgi:hypothetical protein
MPNIPFEAPEGFTLQVSIPISHLREVEFHYILGHLTVAEESAMICQITPLISIVRLSIWQCRAERSCIMCSTIFQSQHDSTKPTGAVQILGFSTHTWQWQYEVFYCSETLDPTSFGNVSAHFARRTRLGYTN